MKNPLYLALVPLLAVSSAHAEDEAVALDIQPQPLAGALERLAQETKLQLLYPAEAVAGKRTAGLSGRYTPQAALEKLLEGTGLTFRYTGAQTVAIRPSGPASRRPAVQSEESPPISLEPMVVTATKIERPASEVPATTAVIEDKQIKEMYNRDLSDVLQRAAGLDVQRTGTNGIAKIDIRGLGFGRTSTLINGQFADFLDPGIGSRSAIQTVDWDNVDRVEIVRGAGSALYGPNAMGGVVNIITKEAPEGPNVTRPFFLFDSLPTYGGGFTTGGTVDGIGYFLDFKHLSSDGYQSAPEPAIPTGEMGTMLHSLEKGEWNKTLAGGRLNWTISDNADLKLGFNYLDDHNNAYDRPHTPADGQYGQYSLEYGHWLTDDDQLTVNLSYRDHQASLTFDSYLYPFSLSTNPLYLQKEDGKKLSGEIRNRWNIAEGHTLLVGFYGSQDWINLRTINLAKGTLDNHPRNDITNYAVYGQYELALWDRLFLTMGGRADWFEYDLANDVTGRAARQSYGIFNPRGGVRFKFSDEVSLRASVGTGFRPPDSSGLTGGVNMPFYEFRPNPSLKPEKSDSFDLGLDVTTPFGTSLSATGYYNELTQYQLQSMYLENGRQIYQTRNLGKVQSYGAELEIRQRITPELALFANYTYSLSEAASDSPPGASGLPEKGKQLPLTPRNKAAFGLMYESDRFSGRFEGRYVDRQFIAGDTRNDPAYALGSYVTADFRVTYRHPIGEKHTLDVSAGVRNLLDRRNETRWIDVLTEPRVGFVQLGVEF
ncbi:TonB-dependent receptor domain-containing protein [Methylocaldum sp. MU1018]